jgi:NADH:ubiquinone oxidoreductase subunit 2 (subunit N)
MIPDFLMSINNELKGLSLGILLIFSGFLFKIAASPFHN